MSSEQINRQLYALEKIAPTLTGKRKHGVLGKINQLKQYIRERQRETNWNNYLAQ